MLRSFVAIVDAESFTLAAEHLHMTQSTISQQLAANTAMARVFGDFAHRHREIRLDVTAGLSRDLTRRYRAGEFDIVVVKEPEASPDCRASFPEAMAWFESADAPGNWPNPMPLVTFPPGGLYREAMFERIEREQLRWYVAFTGSSLHNVLAAVEAGLGLSLLPTAAGGYRIQPYAPFGIEPMMAISLYAWENAGPLAELVSRMAAILAARHEQGFAAPGQKRQ
jgi:DNA-binding transcriptional LysR family regulator